jgi:hypothetical protein
VSECVCVRVCSVCGCVREGETERERERESEHETARECVVHVPHVCVRVLHVHGFSMLSGVCGVFVALVCVLCVHTGAFG